MPGESIADMDLGTRIGIASLIITFLAVGVTILWPTKRPIAYVCFLIAAVLGGWWFVVEHSKRPYSEPTLAPVITSNTSEQKVTSTLDNPSPPKGSVDATPHAQRQTAPITQPAVTDPIAELTQLGWTVKKEKDFLIFELTYKPLPEMEKSAGYFRAIKTPFHLHLLGVPNITEIRLLAGISNFVAIEISASDLTDVSFLANLVSLTSLNINQNGNSILNIAPIKSLTNLTELQLSNVSDVEPLRGMHKLTNVTVVGWQLRDISPMQNLKSLKVVSLGGNVTDLSPLAGDESLEELSIGGKQAGSLSKLAGLSRLKKLRISDQEAVDLSQLGSLQHLEILSLWQLPVMDLSCLRGLRHLKSLDIWGYFGTSLLPSYQQGSKILNVDSIGELSELQILNLQSVQVGSLGFINGCTNLTELNLSYMPITSMSELSNIKTLRKVTLVGIPIVEISPLLVLPNLESVTIVRTPARADVISQLQGKGVKVEVH